MAKYLNKKVEIDGYKFDSKVEAEYYQFLLNKWVNSLIVHPTYQLQEPFTYAWKKYRAICYEADFSFLVNSRLVVVDIKWLATP